MLGDGDGARQCNYILTLSYLGDTASLRPFGDQLLISYGAIASVVFGVVQRLIRPLDEGLLVVRVFGDAGDPQGQRDLERALVRRERLLGDVEADPFGELLRPGRVGPFHDDGELLAAVARDHVDLPDAV